MTNSIDNYINDEIKKIDSEIQAEEDIRDFAEYIARNLAFSSSLGVKVKDDVYILSMKRVQLPNSNKQEILLAAANEAKQKMYSNRYMPALYTAEYNDNFTLEENCQTLISSFLAHVTGNLKVETLDEDNDEENTYKFVKEQDIK